MSVQGVRDLLPNLNFTARVDNVTIDSPLHRVMSTQSIGYATASTWTTSHVLTNYMSLGLSSYPERNPSTIESLTKHNSVMAPLVNVYCEKQHATAYNQNVSALTPGFQTLSGSDGVESPFGTFDVRKIWDENTLANSNTIMIAFEEDLPNATCPGLLSFVYSPAKPKEGANITLCGINAAWEPIQMWASLNENGGTVLTNFTWDEYDSEWTPSSIL